MINQYSLSNKKFDDNVKDDITNKENKIKKHIKKIYN